MNSFSAPPCSAVRVSWSPRLRPTGRRHSISSASFFSFFFSVGLSADHPTTPTCWISEIALGDGFKVGVRFLSKRKWDLGDNELPVESSRARAGSFSLEGGTGRERGKKNWRETVKKKEVEEEETRSSRKRGGRCFSLRRGQVEALFRRNHQHNVVGVYPSGFFFFSPLFFVFNSPPLHLFFFYFLFSLSWFKK